jgi:parallel beta-helix repeat protein
MTALVAAPELEGAVVCVTGANSHNGLMFGTEISDLTVVGNAGSGVGTDCIRFNSQNGAVIRNLSIERLVLDSAARHGLHFEDVAQHIQIRDVWIGHCVGNAYELASGDRYWLTNCYGYLSYYGLQVSDSVDSITITASHFRQNDRGGLVVRAPFYQLLGGRVIDNNGPGVDITGGRGSITGLEVMNNTECGIILRRTEETTSRGNRILGNVIGNTSMKTDQAGTTQGDGPCGAVQTFRQIAAEYGVREAVDRTVRYVTAIGNDEASKQKYGIVIEAGVADTVIGNNMMNDNLKEPISDAGIRSCIDGSGVNDGSPTTTGSWHGRGREGVVVWDRSNEALYIYIGGSWRGPL